MTIQQKLHREVKAIRRARQTRKAKQRREYKAKLIREAAQEVR